MDEQSFKQKKEELQKEYPAMFSRSGLESGEVWLGDIMCEATGIQVQQYKSAGLVSARFSRENYSTRAGNHYWPIFANLREYLELDEKYKQEHPCS